MSYLSTTIQKLRYLVNRDDGDFLILEKSNGAFVKIALDTPAARDAAITTAVNNLLAGAPGALDTLNELATALGDDANFATTVTTALGTRLKWRGAWAAATAYAINDLVLFNGGLYLAPTAFTSAASFVKTNWTELVPQTNTYARLAGPTAFTGLMTWRTAPNQQLIVKPQGDGTAGIFDLTNDDTAGYLFHLHAGPNSAAPAYLLGLGLDAGAAGGLLISAKAGGIGQQIVHNPTSVATGFSVLAYSGSAFPFEVDQYVGAKPLVVVTKTGAGFADGVATPGSTTFTSASAAFTGADVGASLQQLTSTPSAPTVIPAGTTIVSVTNATTVVLSQPASGAATGMPFFVSGRVASTSQIMMQFQPAVASQNVLDFRLPGDANRMFRIVGNGAMDFGSGGASATDTNLYRATNGRLATDNQFQAVQGLITRLLSGAGKTTVSDADFTRAPVDGMTVIVRNTTDSTAKLATRVNGAWMYVSVA